MPFALGSFAFAPSEVYLERPERDSLVIPLDAIVGTRALAFFDLWFDYDDGALYARPFS